MKILDLFSGSKSWSRAFKERGHQVLTVDIEKEYNPDLCADILKLTPEELKPFGPYDVILASPVCDEYCKASLPQSWACNRKRKPNPDNAQVIKTLQLIQALKPKFWIIENVRGAVPYFKPILGKPVRHVGSRYLWGDFPMFDTAPKYGKWKLPKTKDRPFKRAMIPYSLSMALCLSCEMYLQPQIVPLVGDRLMSNSTVRDNSASNDAEVTDNKI